MVFSGVLYVTTPASSAIAVDRDTGKEIWVFDPFSNVSGTCRPMPSRGVAYWEGYSPVTCAGEEHKVGRRIFYATLDGRLFALDPQTGRPCQSFGNGGAVNLREGVADKWPKGRIEMTSPPAIYKDLVITGGGLQEFPSRGPSGAVRAFDVRTGELVWRFDTVPGPGQRGHETWEGDSWKDRSGPNVWSIMSVNVDRGMIFLPIGYVFVNINKVGAVGFMKPQPEGSPEAYVRTSEWGAYARFWDDNHYPCQQPPWGTLNAVDLNTGEIAWKIPLGVVDELEAKGIPKTGVPALGGSIATAGGLVFITLFSLVIRHTSTQRWIVGYAMVR